MNDADIVKQPLEEIQKRNWMNNAVGLVASSDIVVNSVDRCSTIPLQQLQKNDQSNKVQSEAAGSYNQNSNYSNNKYSATFYKNIFFDLYNHYKKENCSFALNR